MADSSVPIPDGVEEKEVYAFAGLAFYWAQVMEREVMNFIAVNQLLKERPRTREAWEAVVDEPAGHTLGRLLRRAKALGTLPYEVAVLLDQALTERNRLIHHFFFDHGEDFLTISGREKMFVELRAAIVLCKCANDALEPESLKVSSKFGLTQDAIDREMRAMFERTADDSALGENHPTA